MLLCGIDESGRGPLLGPLVLAGVLINEKDEQKLVDLKVKDSKLLTKEKREELFEKIKEIGKYQILVVPASEVDDAVNGKNSLNLNRLEAVKTAEIIDELSPNKAIVDAPSNNIPMYVTYLKSKITNKNITIQAEHKADMIYPVVSAASILAKVTRDREVEKLKKEIGIDFGSGYMSDKKTVDFLEKHHEEYGHIIRKSWSSYRDVIDKKTQSTLDSFSESIEKKNESKFSGEIKKLKELGYHEIETKGSSEVARLKGACTVTFYTTGKILVQGKEQDKKNIEKVLGL